MSAYSTFPTYNEKPQESFENKSKFFTLAKIVAAIGGISLMIFANIKFQHTHISNKVHDQNLLTTSSSNPFADWRLQKYTLNVHSSSGLKTQNLFSDIFCTSKSVCPSDLGCGSLRSWCEIGSPFSSNEFSSSYFELHWVDSNILNDFVSEKTGQREMDKWIDYFTKLNDDMTVFNAFMHNKIQLYFTNLKPVYSRLQMKEIKTMRRLSVDSDGQDVLHIGFEMAGRIYEFIGSNYEKDDKILYWNEETECGIIHKLSKSLSYYKKLAEQSDFPTFNNMPAAMVISISVGVHDALGSSELETAPDASKISTLYNHLTSYTGAILTDTINEETCAAKTLTWDAMPGFQFHYVTNSYANEKLSKGFQLIDYDRYSSSLHAHYSSKKVLSAYDGEWYGWDHMMDQHVGFWFSGSDTEAVIGGTCSERATKVREGLTKANLAVGERGENDAHEMYVGYAGPMTWEYQFDNCDAGKPDAPSECACIGSNNNQDYPQCTEETTDDWCH